MIGRPDQFVATRLLIVSEDSRDRVAHALGHAIRRARRRLGLSMRDVAGKAGVSQPFLSDLENGRAMPSITTLYRLAETFDLAPQELLPSLRGDDIVLVRAGAEPEPIDDSPGVALSLLVAGGPGRLIEVRRYRLAPDIPVGAWHEHEGEDLLFLVDGAMRIEFDTGVEERLGAGDALWHSGLVPHRWRSEPGRGAELLLVKGRPLVTSPTEDHE
jgi:DNA-binding XRE family transcriptional regulator